MVLELVLFSQLSGSCAPGDSAITLASIAKTESGFDSLAIHDNTDGRSYHPSNVYVAGHLAHELIVRRGHSVDLGLMQIDSSNLSRLGLSIADTFDPCHSIGAGARVLRDGYQRALRLAFSHYNTGDPSRGFTNGYVQHVEVSAAHLPTIQLGSVPAGIVASAQIAPIALTTPPAVIDMIHANDVVVPSTDSVGNLLVDAQPRAVPR